jgi:hypothetical protein
MMDLKPADFRRDNSGIVICGDAVTVWLKRLGVMALASADSLKAAMAFNRSADLDFSPSADPAVSSTSAAFCWVIWSSDSTAALTWVIS